MTLYHAFTNPLHAPDTFGLSRKDNKMKKVNWWIVGTVVILASILLFGGGMMSGWRSGGYGGHMSWGYSPFGWLGMGIGMLFMWLVPIGLLAFVVYGVVALTRNSGNNTPVTSQSPCPNCGKDTQSDWQTCPYCGTSLK